MRSLPFILYIYSDYSEEILGIPFHSPIYRAIFPLVAFDGLSKSSIDNFLNLQTFTFGDNTYLSENVGLDNSTEALFLDFFTQFPLCVEILFPDIGFLICRLLRPS